MRTKKVNRYWCDFCNKAGLSAGAMQRHERHCTMNPARTCRVCLLIEDNMDSDEFEAKKPLAELITMLPDSAPYRAEFCGPALADTYEALTGAIDAILPSFRRASGNCPACMLAAIRLAKIPVFMVENFKFKEEMQSVFAELEPRHGYDY